MKVDWLSVIVGACLLVAAVLLVVACEPAKAPVPDPRYTGGLSACVADVAIAKAQMKLAGNVDKAKLYDRYEACTHNVIEVFGFDAGIQEE